MQIILLLSSTVVWDDCVVLCRADNNSRIFAVARDRNLWFRIKFLIAGILAKLKDVPCKVRTLLLYVAMEK